MLVYKYRGGSFKRDLQSLKNDTFWASNTKQLNDPYEGLYPLKIISNNLITLRIFFLNIELI